MHSCLRVVQIGSNEIEEQPGLGRRGMGCLESVGAHPSLHGNSHVPENPQKPILTLADRFLRSRLQRVKRWRLVVRGGVSGYTRICMMIMEIVARIQVAKESPKIVGLEW